MAVGAEDAWPGGLGSRLLTAVVELRWGRPDLVAAVAEHAMDIDSDDDRRWVAATGWLLHGRSAVGDGREPAVTAIEQVSRRSAGLLHDPAAHRLRVEIALLAATAAEHALARQLVAPALAATAVADVRADALAVLARCEADERPDAVDWSVGPAADAWAEVGGANGEIGAAAIALVAAAALGRAGRHEAAAEHAAEGLSRLDGLRGRHPATPSRHLGAALAAEWIGALLDAGRIDDARDGCVPLEPLLREVARPSRQAALLKLTVARALSVSSVDAVADALEEAARDAAASDTPDLEVVCLSTVAALHERSGRHQAALDAMRRADEARQRDSARQHLFLHALKALAPLLGVAAPESAPPESALLKSAPLESAPLESGHSMVDPWSMPWAPGDVDDAPIGALLARTLAAATASPAGHGSAPRAAVGQDAVVDMHAATDVDATLSRAGAADRYGAPGRDTEAGRHTPSVADQTAAGAPSAGALLDPTPLAWRTRSAPSVLDVAWAADATTIGSVGIGSPRRGRSGDVDPPAAGLDPLGGARHTSGPSRPDLTLVGDRAAGEVGPGPRTAGPWLTGRWTGDEPVRAVPVGGRRRRREPERDPSAWPAWPGPSQLPDRREVSDVRPVSDQPPASARSPVPDHAAASDRTTGSDQAAISDRMAVSDRSALVDPLTGPRWAGDPLSDRDAQAGHRSPPATAPAWAAAPGPGPRSVPGSDSLLPSSPDQWTDAEPSTGPDRGSARNPSAGPGLLAVSTSGGVDALSHPATSPFPEDLLGAPFVRASAVSSVPAGWDTDREDWLPAALAELDRVWGPSLPSLDPVENGRGATVIVDLVPAGPPFAADLLHAVVDRLADVMPVGARLRRDEEGLVVTVPGWDHTEAGFWMRTALPGPFAQFASNGKWAGVAVRASVHDDDGPVGAQLVQRLDVAPGRHRDAGRRVSGQHDADPATPSGATRARGVGAHRAAGGGALPAGSDVPDASGVDTGVGTRTPFGPGSGAADGAAEPHPPVDADAASRLARPTPTTADVIDRSGGRVSPTAVDTEGLGIADLLAGALAAYRGW